MKFLAALIHGKLFVQPGDHLPNPSLGKTLRAKRMTLLQAMKY